MARKRSAAMTMLKTARVLIADPDIMLAVHLTHELVSQGADVPVVAPTLKRVLQAVAEDGFDAVVVEPRFDEGDITPAVMAFIADDVPMVVTSLLPPAMLPAPLASCSYMRKPYNIRAAVSGLAEVLAGRKVVQLRPSL
jgi:DNA-binding NtrC family response regulator